METDKEKLEEIHEKVEQLHKGFIETMREAQLETGDLEITCVSDTAVNEEPQSDDLLPVDTALMEKCVATAAKLFPDQYIRSDPFAQSLFIGALLNTLVGAVNDLRHTILVGLYEVNEKLEARQ